MRDLSGIPDKRGRSWGPNEGADRGHKWPPPGECLCSVCRKSIGMRGANGNGRGGDPNEVVQRISTGLAPEPFEAQDIGRLDNV